MAETLLVSLTGSLKNNKPVSAEVEARILGLLEQRRKLMDHEVKRLRDLGQMVPAERVCQLMREAAGITVEVLKLMAEKLSLAPLPYQRMVRDRFARAVHSLPHVVDMEPDEGE